ncbi:sensor histidine kinase [Devriesea agamarum]|uniref:sensor histidine kinase n=1 Tax=Devriesea agamarum TaxID=472569 RepID=UPI00071DA007|nr:histidine kinase [Devriesea agamarum]
MNRPGSASDHDRFRAIFAYVHLTHILLALGTLIAPAISFIQAPRPAAVVIPAILASVCVSAGASFLVIAEFAPHHRGVRWLRGPAVRRALRIAVLLMTLTVITLVPASKSPTVAVAIPLTWALSAICTGPFWSGIVRLFAVTLATGLATFVIDMAQGHSWDGLTLLVAALIALGVIGQDSIYILLIELDDLRTLEAERAVITERKRFAGDLHDIQGQHLGLITVEAELVSRLIDRADYAAAAQHAERIQAITLDALDEMHRLVHANREVRLDEEIANAVRVLRSAGIEVTRDTIGISGLDDDTDRLLGLSVREGITNILKHTQAHSCSLSVRQQPRHRRAGIALVVTDSGPGAAVAKSQPAYLKPARYRAGQSSEATQPPAAGRPSGAGLIMLAERYRAMGGTLDFTQERGGRLSCWLPLPMGDVHSRGATTLDRGTPDSKITVEGMSDSDMANHRIQASDRTHSMPTKPADAIVTDNGSPVKGNLE